MVYVLSLGTWQHGNWIAPIVFIEALGRASCSAHHAWVHGSHHWVVVEAWVELRVYQQRSDLDVLVGLYHLGHLDEERTYKWEEVVERDNSA